MHDKLRLHTRYLLALVIAGVAFGVDRGLGLQSGARYLLVYPAVFLSAYFLGIGPTSVAAIGSIAAILTSSSMQNHQPGGSLRLALQTSVFALTTVLIIWLRWRTIQAENELRIGREEFQSFFNTASAGMSQTVPWSGRILRINKAFCQMLGYGETEMLGRPFFEFTHPDDRAKSWAGYQEVVKGATRAFREEKRFIRKDGSVVWGDVMVNLVRDPEGRPLRVSAVALDATERKNLEEAFRESQADLNRAQAVARVGSWRSDLARKQLTWSDETYRIFGVPIGTPMTYEKFLSLVHEEDRASLNAKWEETLVRGEPFEYQHRITVNNELKWIRERAEFRRGGKGELIRGIGTAQDITDLKRAEQAMLAAKTAAEEANRMKDLFLATLSHELRTPLTAILSWAQLLRRGKLGEEKTKTGLRVIEESARAQTQLIDDLMDVSRIITGKLWVTLEAVDLVQILRSVIDSIRLTAEKKSILIRESFGDTPLIVSADQARMKQVFWNILSNSVKFTPAGGLVNVSVTAFEDGKGSRAIIKIQDNGKGISPHFLPHIFGRFSQADLSSVRVHGGLGIGLALVKSLLELQGGVVEASSPGEGKGATFSVTLPLLKENPLPVGKVAEQVAARGVLPDLSGIEILLVDDEKATLEALGEALISFGAKLRTASSAKEALEALEDFIPSLIISDIAMPGEDGYSLIRKIRALDPSRGGSVPAIALTAYAGAEYRQKALLEGFQMCLSKPIDTSQLAESALEAIRGKRRARQSP